jgi:carnitine 3-dehydrogenase
MKTIAIIGTGVLGTGWAARFFAHGHRVKVWDPSIGFEDKVRAKLTSLWPTLVTQGIAASASLDNLAFSDSLEAACEGVFLVQESAPENLELKRALHAQIDAAAAPETIVASSSSGLLPSDIQTATQHPERMLIGHPFNPVYLLPLVELVGGKQTARETIDTAKAFYSSLGLQPLVGRKEIVGDLSDRLQEALWREALHLVNDDVATTAELDAAIIYGPGLRWAFMGTCLTFHLAGGESGMRHMLEQFGPALKLPWTKLQAPELTDSLIDKMVTGTAEQPGDKSIEDLAPLRDQCLIDIMQALSRYQPGAGALIQPQPAAMTAGDSPHNHGNPS